MAKAPDFNQFGEALWEIANVFRDDALHATERLETFSLFLFLKLWDEIAGEHDSHTGTKISDDDQLIPEIYRFHNWAGAPDLYAREHNFEDSVDMCRHMFDDLAVRQSNHSAAKDVRRLFHGTPLRIRYPETVNALATRLIALNLREVMARGIGVEGERYDVFGRAYEYLLQQFGQNKEFAELQIVWCS
jgi:type I restriction enzyme M protein